MKAVYDYVAKNLKFKKRRAYFSLFRLRFCMGMAF